MEAFWNIFVELMLGDGTQTLAMIPALGGLAGGAFKHFAIDKPKERAQRKYRANVARYSPWTGMNPMNAPQAQSASMLQSGIKGLTQGSGMAGKMMGGKGGGGLF